MTVAALASTRDQTAEVAQPMAAAPRADAQRVAKAAQLIGAAPQEWPRRARQRQMWRRPAASGGCHGSACYLNQHTGQNRGRGRAVGGTGGEGGGEAECGARGPGCSCNRMPRQACTRSSMRATVRLLHRVLRVHCRPHAAAQAWARRRGIPRDALRSRPRKWSSPPPSACERCGRRSRRRCAGCFMQRSLNWRSVLQSYLHARRSGMPS